MYLRYDESIRESLMRSKIVSILAASALMVAVPTVASAQDDTRHHGNGDLILGVSFALTVMLILILAKHKHADFPVSP
jgi:formate/nitrite transporter FocA (FNT family)